MFCDNCGNEIPDNSTFCPECGTPVANRVQQETVSNEPADNVVNTMPHPEMPVEVKEKSKKPLIIVLALVIILGVGAFGFNTYMTQKAEEEYREKIVLFGNNLVDNIAETDDFVVNVLSNIDNVASVVYDSVDGITYESAFELAVNVAFTDTEGTQLDENEFFEDFNDLSADLSARAEQLKNDFAELSEPPERYADVYNEIKTTYDRYVTLTELATATATYTENSYDNLIAKFQEVAFSDEELAELEELIANDPQVTANYSTAQSIYNEIGVIAVNYKVATGNFPTCEELIGELNNADDSSISIPSGITAAVSYSVSDGEVNSVWVCSSENGITGTENDEYLACYDPDIDGNAADTANFSYNIICINGGDWQVKQ